MSKEIGRQERARIFLQSKEFEDAFTDVHILGAVGLNGAGKDSFMDLFGPLSRVWTHSTSEPMRRISEPTVGNTDRGGNNTTLGKIANAYGRSYPGGVVDVGLLRFYFEVLVPGIPQDNVPVAIAVGSLRRLAEIERIKSMPLSRVYEITAPVDIRYARTCRRRRADEAGDSMETFQLKEAAELAAEADGSDPSVFSMAAAIKAADEQILNDSTPKRFAARAGSALARDGIEVGKLSVPTIG